MTLEPFESIHNYSIRRIRELLALSAEEATEENINNLIDYYFHPDNSNHLFLAQSEDVTLGIIGFHHYGHQKGFIKHISVDPELRWKGVGRFMMEGIANRFSLAQLEAEATEGCLPFFEACGFHIQAMDIGRKGNSRYQCTKHYKRRKVGSLLMS